MGIKKSMNKKTKSSPKKTAKSPQKHSKSPQKHVALTLSKQVAKSKKIHVGV